MQEGGDQLCRSYAKGARNVGKRQQQMREKVKLPLRREFPEERHRVDHGGRLVGGGGKALSELVAKGHHVVREVEAVILEDRRYARDTVQGVRVLDRNDLP